ncbi:MAG: T9SS type A sorting domain-containing protein [Rhodothermales bacterium]
MSVTPTFMWGAVAEADTYRLQVSTASNFSSTVIDQSAIATNSYTPGAPLAIGTLYYWRVRATNAGGSSTYSTVWSFTTEVSKQVILLSPSDGATGIDLSPNLMWNAVIGATSYSVQVSKSANMSSPIVDESSVAATSLSIGPLDPSTIYHWRVRADNAAADLWSSVWSFVTGTGAPGQVTLISPADNATSVATGPTFKWHKVASASSYRFDLSTDSGFGSFVVSQSPIADTTYTPSVALDNGQEYFWRVRGSNGTGDGDFSATFSFETAVSAPGTPTLNSPANGALAVSITPTFTWNAVTQGLAKTADGQTGADTYDIDVATDGNFNSKVVSETGLTGTSYDQAALANGVQYFWRVRGVNTAGPGPWSATFNFTTIAGGAEQVTLSSPANGATEVDLSPTLVWNAVSGAATYQVELSKQSNFTSLALNLNSVGGTQTQVTGLDGSTLYYWRVRANNSGSENWSETWSFTTGSGTPDQVTLLSPIDGSTNTPVNVTLSWNQAQKAEAYQVQVATDTKFENLLIDLTGVSGTSMMLSDLIYGQIYSWRVRGTNSVTEGEWSTRRDFQTVRGGDRQVKIVSPEGGATGIPLETELVWNKVDGATSYHVQVATSFSFNLSSIVYEESQHPDTVFALTDLAPDTTYAWRVLASNAGGSNWSITASFLTGNGVPSQVVLESPLNDAVDIDLEPELIWTVPTRATSFNLEVALDEEFSTVLLSETGLTDVVFQAPELDPVTDYFWRVQGVNQDGAGPWSETRKFTTIGVAPPAPAVLISPLNGAAEVSYKPLFSWNASEGATSYKLEVATNPTFSTVTIAVVVAQPFFQSAGLSLGQGYYWRVEARNAGGSALSEAWSFTTVLTTDTEDEEIPENFSLSQNYPNPFNPSTSIEFAMPKAGNALLVVYNIRGEEVARLVDGFTPAGRHIVQWNAGYLPSGVYLYRFQSEGFTEVRKLTLTK